MSQSHQWSHWARRTAVFKTHMRRCDSSYPKVNIEVASAAKLAVADLEGDGHLVIAVQRLVEALAAVGGQLDVVGESRVDEASCEEQLGDRREDHDGGSFARARGVREAQ